MKDPKSKSASRQESGTRKTTRQKETAAKRKKRVNQYRPPRVHRQTLVEMNVSVFTARRNAAHQYVIDILHHDMLHKEKKERRKLYLLCGILLEEALMCTRRSQLQIDSAVVHYLGLLRDTINALEALLRHEIKLTHESRELSGMLNQYVLSQLQSGDRIFSDSEANVLDCIEDLIKFGNPIMSQDSQERIKNFSDEDRRRYDLALQEYQAYYQQFNIDNQLERWSRHGF